MMNEEPVDYMSRLGFTKPVPCGANQCFGKKVRKINVFSYIY